MSVGAARPAARIPAIRATVAELPLAPLAVGVITAAAFAFRLSQLHQSLFGDEVWTYLDVVHRSLGNVLSTVHTGAENSPPLFFVLAWASAKLGDPTVLIRLPSLILGVATIPVIYLLGRDAISRTAGVVGAAIMAASPFATYYGIEARMYTTTAFFVVVSTLALVRAVRTSGWRWWLLYALAAAAAAYSHYTAIFALGTQAIWSLWACRDRLRLPLLANALVVLLYLPWLPHVRGKALPLFAAFEPLTAHHVIRDMASLIPGYPYASLSAIPTDAGLALIGVLALLGLVSVGLKWRAAGYPRVLPERAPGGPVLILALALATPIGVLLYSILGTDLWNPRIQYASLPAAALILGALLCSLPRIARPIAVVAVLATLVAGSIRAIGPRYARPPFNTVGAYLDRVAGPRVPIVLDPVTWGIKLQLKGPHRVVHVSPTWSRSVPAGGAVYTIFADKLAPFLGTATQPPPDFKLVWRRRYAATSVWSFTLARYRRP